MRIAGWVSAGAAVVAAGGLLYALSGLGSATYVSEAGVPETGQSLVYRVSVFAIGLAVGALAVALRTPTRAWPAAAVLGLSTPFVLVSGAVTCSPGCPLPPYQRPTAADLVHAGTTVVALALTGLAMLLLAWRLPRCPLRTIGRLGVGVAVPLLAASGLALLIAGRGPITGVLERLALAASLTWLVATAVAVAVKPRGTSSPPDPGSR